MVRGMEKFKEYFKSFGGNYVITGGTACEIHEENNALVPRATKDIDIILVVEALSDDFVEGFWQFVKDGHYGEKSKGVNQLADPHQTQSSHIKWNCFQGRSIHFVCLSTRISRQFLLQMNCLASLLS